MQPHSRYKSAYRGSGINNMSITNSASDIKNLVETISIVTLFFVAKWFFAHFFCKDEKKPQFSAVECLGLILAWVYSGTAHSLAHLIFTVVFAFARLLNLASDHMELSGHITDLGGWIELLSLLGLALNGTIGIFL